MTTGAERQRRYRQQHLGPDGTLGRVNVLGQCLDRDTGPVCVATPGTAPRADATRYAGAGPRRSRAASNPIDDGTAGKPLLPLMEDRPLVGKPGSLNARSRKKAVPYSPEIAQTLLERLSRGESLRSICKSSDMPDESTVRYWAIHDREGFGAAYHEARNIALDIMADEVIRIADGEDGTGDPIRDRLRFDARRWYLSKMAPKRYGEAHTLRHELHGAIDLRAAIRAGEARAGQRLAHRHERLLSVEDRRDDAE